MSYRFRFVTLTAILAMVLFGIANASNSWNGQSATGGFDSFEPLDHGGPDGYGYYYIDSRDSAFNAPEYNWIEIESFGTPLGFNGDDQNTGPFLIGFTFNHYGIDFLTFRACTNGFISFTSTSNEYSNVAIPNALEPNNLLAAYWDDFIFTDSGSAYYYTNDTDTLIVEWKNAPYFDESGVASFQIILTADGNILYQYQYIGGTLNSHTIGIENQGGTVGLQYVYNSGRDETGTAIRFSLSPPNFGAKDVLVIAADEASEYVAALSAFADMDTVTYFDARNGTPTLQQLQEYDCAVVWSNYVFDDPVAMGNVLADYLDAGGGVVLHMFCFRDSWYLGGRIMADYSPFNTGTVTDDRVLGSYDAGHPIMWNVDALYDTFTANVTLAHSPVVVASYSDGTPMVAYNPTNNLVALNTYVGDYNRNGGDPTVLSHNAINFAMSGPAEILFIMADVSGSITRRALLEYPDISSVHFYYGRLATPSLAFLQLYDLVVVWSDYQFDDALMMGNRLADYVDVGKDVVITQFAFSTGWELQGRLMSSYSPFGAGTLRYQTRTLGVHQPGHYLMNGVDAVTEYYTAAVTVQNGGITVASWDDSTPFVAFNQNNNVVAINGYVGNDQQFTGDMITLLHNAINFARGNVSVDGDPSLPALFNLAQNYPNPFNPATTISFDIPQRSNVVVEIFNVLGQKVQSIDRGRLDAGHHSFVLDASNLSSGVYFYKLNAGENTRTRKMTVLK
jgi:hypothetical protein